LEEKKEKLDEGYSEYLFIFNVLEADGFLCFFVDGTYIKLMMKIKSGGKSPILSFYYKNA